MNYQYTKLEDIFTAGIMNDQYSKFEDLFTTDIVGIINTLS